MRPQKGSAVERDFLVAKNEDFCSTVYSCCEGCSEKRGAAAEAPLSPASPCCCNRLLERQALRCELEQLFSVFCFVPGLGTVPSLPQKANRVEVA